MEDFKNEESENKNQDVSIAKREYKDYIDISLIITKFQELQDYIRSGNINSSILALMTLNKYLQDAVKEQQPIDFPAIYLDFISNLITETDIPQIIVLTSSLITSTIFLLGKTDAETLMNIFIPKLAQKLDTIDITCSQELLYETIYRLYRYKLTSKISRNFFSISLLINLSLRESFSPYTIFNMCLAYQISRNYEIEDHIKLIPYIEHFFEETEDKAYNIVFLELIRAILEKGLIPTEEILRMNVHEKIIPFFMSESKKYTDLASNIIGFLANSQIYVPINLDMIFIRLNSSSEELTNSILWMINCLLDNVAFQIDFINHIKDFYNQFDTTCYSTKVQISYIFLHFLEFIDKSKINLITDLKMIGKLIEVIDQDDNRIIYNSITQIARILQLLNEEDKQNLLTFLHDTLSDSIDDLEDKDYDPEYDSAIHFIIDSVSALFP